MPENRCLWIGLFVILALSGELAAQSFEQSIARISLSRAGRQELLQQSLNGIVGVIQKHLEQAPLNDKLLQVNPSDCTREKMAAMGSLEIWKKCPGIPDYFFKDGSYFSGYRPRLVTLSLSEIKVITANIGFIKTSCDDETCTVEIPLDNLELKANVDISQKRSSSRFVAGQKILSIPKASIQISPNQLGELPTLRLKARFNNTDSSNNQVQNFFSFDASESTIFLPSGSVQTSLPENLNQASVSEILEQTGVLTVNQYIFSGLLTIASQLNEDLYQLYQLLDLNLPLNAHFNDVSKIKHVNHLANTRLLPTLLDLINEGINHSMIFQGTKIELPSGGLQDLFDQPKLSSQLAKVEFAVSQMETQLLRNQCLPVTSSSESWEILRTGLAKSKSSSILEQVETTGKNVTHLIHMANQTQCKPIADILWSLKSILDTSANDIIKNIQQLSAHLDLRLDIQRIPQKPGHLTFTLSEILNSDASTNHPDQETVLFDDSDFSGSVRFHTINRILELAWHQGRFNICIESDSNKTCDQLEDLSSQTHLSCPDAPGIFWDESLQKHFLDVKLSGPDQTSEYKLWLKPFLNDSGILTLSHQLELTHGSVQTEAETLFITGLVKFMQSIHPLLMKLLPKDIRIKDVESYEDNVTVDLPWLTMSHMNRSKDGMYFSGYINNL